VVRLELRLGHQLGERRRAAVRRLELLARALQLEAALLHVDRDPDRVRLVRDRALAGLADPPRRVGRELEALAVVELLDRAVQPDRAVLDQVEQRQAVALVALGDRNDQAQVRVDHLLLRRGVATLDPLRERNLLGGVQERVLADLVQEELQAVRDHTGRAQVELAGGLPGVDGLLDLDVGRGKCGPYLVDGVVVELVLELEGLELGSCDHTAVAGLMEEAGHSRIGIQGIRAQSNIRTHQKFLSKAVSCQRAARISRCPEMTTSNSAKFLPKNGNPYTTLTRVHANATSERPKPAGTLTPC
jgi:hypothetical protein